MASKHICFKLISFLKLYFQNKHQQKPATSWWSASVKNRTDERGEMSNCVRLVV